MDEITADFWAARRSDHALAPERALFCEVVRLAFEDATQRKGPPAAPTSFHIDYVGYARLAWRIGKIFIQVEDAGMGDDQ